MNDQDFDKNHWTQTKLANKPNDEWAIKILDQLRIYQCNENATIAIPREKNVISAYQSNQNLNISIASRQNRERVLFLYAWNYYGFCFRIASEKGISLRAKFQITWMSCSAMKFAKAFEYWAPLSLRSESPPILPSKFMTLSPCLVR